ncbi:hypothetical protein BZA77DRAFT_293264 [Pyronema omphalodes]|nr:hypothetical protein BZA77DRAFT_293264 [Pyronema omphalodes]
MRIFRRSPSPSSNTGEGGRAPAAPRGPPSTPTQSRFSHLRRFSLPTTQQQPSQRSPAGSRTFNSTASQPRTPTRSQRAPRPQGVSVDRPTFSARYNPGTQGSQGRELSRAGLPLTSAMLSSISLPINYINRMVTLLDANIDSQIQKIQIYLMARNRPISAGRRAALPDVPRIIWPNEEMQEAILRFQYEATLRAESRQAHARANQGQGQTQGQAPSNQAHQTTTLQGNQAQVPHRSEENSIRQISYAEVEEILARSSQSSDNRGILLNPGGGWGALLSDGPSLGPRSQQQENQPTRQTNHQAQGSGANQALQVQSQESDMHAKTIERSARWITWMELMTEWTGRHRLEELTQLCNNVVCTHPESATFART